MKDPKLSALECSCLYKEVHDIPLVRSFNGWYTSTKKSSRAINTGLAVVEWGVTSVWERVFMGSEIAARVDALAGNGMCKLKEKFPAVQTSPEELKARASRTIQDSTRSAMTTAPGKFVISGLDWTLDYSERFLRRIRPRDASPRKRKITRSSLKKAVLAKDQSYASEDSGACDGDSAKVDKSQQTVPTVKGPKKVEELTLLQKAYRLGIVFPLEVLVQVLKTVRRYIGGKRRKTDIPVSPEKEKEIHGRRKISPKKKVTSTLLGRIRQRTYHLLGYKHVRCIDLGAAVDGSSPDRGDAEKKRKHDEILTDDASETDENMADFDFDNYDSQDDPDYEPDSMEEEESSDSIGSGDEESDLETEVASKTLELEYLQLKEKDSQLDITDKLPKKEPESIGKESKDVSKKSPAKADQCSKKESDSFSKETKDVISKKSPAKSDQPAKKEPGSYSKASKDAILKKSPPKADQSMKKVTAPEDVTLKPMWQQS